MRPLRLARARGGGGARRRRLGVPAPRRRAHGHHGRPGPGRRPRDPDLDRRHRRRSRARTSTPACSARRGTSTSRRTSSFTACAPGLPDIVSAAHAAGVTVSLDPQDDPAGRWESGLPELVRSVDVLFVNERESAGIDTSGCPLVVVKRGPRGALARTPEGEVEHPAVPVAMVDATGAGDSFDAGFLAAWLAGQPAGRCARAGVRLRGAVDARARRDRRPADAGGGEGGARVILCVAANPSIDRLFTVERLVPGSIHRPAEFVQVPGGKGLNVARAAAALGGDVPRRRAPGRARRPVDRAGARGGGRPAPRGVGGGRDALVALGRRCARGAHRVLRARAAGDRRRVGGVRRARRRPRRRGGVDDPLGLAPRRGAGRRLPPPGRPGPGGLRHPRGGAGRAAGHREAERGRGRARHLDRHERPGRGDRRGRRPARAHRRRRDRHARRGRAR